ncbi:MAG: AAA family ATPase, partial [Actinomycetota bacterium]
MSIAFNAIRDNVQQVVRGKQHVVEQLLLCLLAGGHILIEDVPGVGKTTLAKALSASVGAGLGRIQFTPDLLPADVTGVSVWNRNTSTFEFRPGPIFTELVLADEINRASPKTQSALLEAMAESQVTVDGTTHPLPNPFMVLATQNPIEQEGTYPLPESQLDRFLMKISVGYPARADELAILETHETDGMVDRLQAVANLNDVMAMHHMVTS